ncbi:hypothetical protein KRP22_005792 [Phytophthora ramorum]|nr:hypothetical protein KRP22_3076 [Phytophthora ramorum]
MMVLDGGIPPLSSSSSTNTLPTYPGTEVGRSPPRPGLPHTASESTLTKEALLNILEMRARGVSLGSITDPSYIQQIHSLEDRLKIARTSFDERESSLEAAIRSEEEKHQREIERFRKKMEEFDKQRAAIARQQNGDSAVLSDANGSSGALDESLRLLAQGESLVSGNAQNPSAMLVEFDNDSLDAPTTAKMLLQQCYAGFALNGCKDLNTSAGFHKDHSFETQFTDPNVMSRQYCLQCCTKPVPIATGADETWNLSCPLNDLQRSV